MVRKLVSSSASGPPWLDHCHGLTAAGAIGRSQLVDRGDRGGGLRAGLDRDGVAGAVEDDPRQEQDAALEADVQRLGAGVVLDVEAAVVVVRVARRRVVGLRALLASGDERVAVLARGVVLLLAGDERGRLALEQARDGRVAGAALERQHAGDGRCERGRRDVGHGRHRRGHDFRGGVVGLHGAHHLRARRLRRKRHHCGPMLRVLIAGVTGWTGAPLARAVEAAPDLELAAGVARRDADYASVAEALAAVQADVVVDYTSAAAVRANVDAALAAGAHVVVGSSGLSESDYAEIDAAARAAGRGVVAAGNFSVLAATLLHAATVASAARLALGGDRLRLVRQARRPVRHLARARRAPRRRHARRRTTPT